jgi:serine/threonine protein kinase
LSPADDLPIQSVLHNTRVPIPENLGRLRRVQRLGSGGFASVWLYRDDQLDSLVAVKALADNWSDRADIRERFLDEARILRRADSDFVVRVHDIGVTDDDIPYFVMTYADRGTVADLLVDGVQVDPALVADLVEQAARGLAVIHGLGIVHRDVKPQNLLLAATRDGGTRVLVADLGVAKALLHATGITQVVGTPAYMAPEQVHMETALDQRADVHALGAVAYHLLTGRPARTGDMVTLMRAELPPLPSEVAGLPTAYDGVLLRAVHPDRDERWPDTVTFAKALRQAVDEPTVITPVPRPKPEPAVERSPSARLSGVGVGTWVVALVVMLVAYAAGYLLFR